MRINVSRLTRYWDIEVCTVDDLLGITGIREIAHQAATRMIDGPGYCALGMSKICGWIKLINEIAAHLIDIPPGANMPDMQKLIEMRRAVILLSQSIFKQEWERIKVGD
jgi:hypothetical protein